MNVDKDVICRTRSDVCLCIHSKHTHARTHTQIHARTRHARSSLTVFVLLVFGLFESPGPQRARTATERGILLRTPAARPLLSVPEAAVVPRPQILIQVARCNTKTTGRSPSILYAPAVSRRKRIRRCACLRHEYSLHLNDWRIEHRERVSNLYISTFTKDVYDASSSAHCNHYIA